ncbi:histone deacetylase family protein [Mesorhizobium sp. ES1-1]|uniref:histone deacetylase family protein n=1 Tax=Mesorhizobium sp. ES1-1 TaxID=2876629 RepID=UPI001CCA0F00|nr:histone deacetylase family protein [Mesorhizobium sp. ES1-1]MBZ9676840.1 histone deacetylase family protein [Mesorhizobium sp. ES1-1]
MKAFFAEEQKRHDPKAFLSSGAAQPNPEQPERAARLLAGALAAGCTIERPREYGLGPVAAVHTPEYLDFLEHIFTRWQRIEGASAEVIPNIHPIARNGSYPASAVGQAGYHMADTACPISSDTWQSALWSAWSAVGAAECVLAGAQAAYALCRPPGHHAFADVAGGFCFINNSAVAAEVLRKQAARVAILDVDLHHGNGTQGIFYARSDVLTVSLHADPVRFYPFFWGHADERGEGAGLGYNFNLPLPRKSADGVFLEALRVASQRIQAFAPEALVVALGLDAFEGDPFGGLSVTTPGFSRIGEAVAKLGLPTVIVQEGGYLCDELGDNLTAFLTGFAGTAR